MNMANVDLKIDELMELVAYCYKMADGIPEDAYEQMNAAGTTMGDTARKYRQRGDELYEILNTVWPK